MLYGKTAASAAVAANPDEADEGSRSPKGKDRIEFIPELTKEFFDSPFFRRFQIQSESSGPCLDLFLAPSGVANGGIGRLMATGPVLDPHDFVTRYLSQPHPNAAAMGPEGAILCHVLYAWALSYGVDENGQLDIPEGGGAPLGPLSLVAPGENEMRREGDRQRRFSRMKSVVELVLREIDECGIMRKPTWDGVRSLLLILPLTEG